MHKRVTYTEAQKATAIKKANRLLADGQTVATAAKALGINGKSLSQWLNDATKAIAANAPTIDAPREVYRGPGFDLLRPTTVLPEVADLLERRKRSFARKQRADNESKLIPVKVTLPGPIGILFFGDPHVDDDGTDIASLEQHAMLVRNTEGLFGANIGDTSNNWIGRLARLYADQSTSAPEAWQLVEWFIRLVDWLFIIGGNHDCWSGAGDPINWIASHGAGVYQASEVRIGLSFPDTKRVVTINARHDFAGSSIWNAAHGAMKAAQMGIRDDINVAGHKHVCGYGVVKDPTTGKLCHCFQIGSYKVIDRYAKERGFRDQHISPCLLTVINPFAADPTDVVMPFWNPERGANYLAYLREQHAKG